MSDGYLARIKRPVSLEDGVYLRVRLDELRQWRSDILRRHGWSGLGPWAQWNLEGEVLDDFYRLKNLKGEIDEIESRLRFADAVAVIDG